MIDEPRGTEHDSGPRARGRERLCIATRTVRPISELLRFAAGPDGEAVPDVKSRLPGRGVWVTATREAVGEAVRRRAFARALRREIRIPPDLVDLTERLLEAAVVDALAVAGKAGLAAAGFTKAEAALARGDAIALLHAAGASAEGIRKLDGALRRYSGPSVAVIGFLTSAQLDLALNRPNVVHAALLGGSASETFLARCRRLDRFRAGDQHQQGSIRHTEPTEA